MFARAGPGGGACGRRTFEMNNQLAVKDQATAILDIRALSKAGSTLTALLEHLQQDRVLVEGSTQRSGFTFARVGDTVIRVSSEVEKSPVMLTGHRMLSAVRPSA